MGSSKLNSVWRAAGVGVLTPVLMTTSRHREALVDERDLFHRDLGATRLEGADTDLRRPGVGDVEAHLLAALVVVEHDRGAPAGLVDLALLDLLDPGPPPLVGGHAALERDVA